MDSDYRYNIPEINLEDYDYHLPQDKIANYPADIRNHSKLLFCKTDDGQIKHYLFNKITELIPENSTLIINSTKVIAARLNMQKPTGGRVEVLCVNPVEPSIDPQIVMGVAQNCIWECIIGGRNITENMVLSHHSLDFNAKILKRYENKALIEFSWDSGVPFGKMLEDIGMIPLPPYIRRDTETQDYERYQTVYAKLSGSVAAPTAGLHFTDDILEKLKENRISTQEIILHVGPGTFVPLDSDVESHKMHKERVFVNLNIIEKLYFDLLSGNNIIATGTTSVRTIESLFWAGQKIFQFGELELDGKFVNQWDPYYNYKELLEPHKSLEILINYLKAKSVGILSGETSLFILPGYKFKIINGMITNFHLPKSTLILLVAAFTGRELWRKMYNEALFSNYRFLSYGDATLLLRDLN